MNERIKKLAEQATSIVDVEHEGYRGKGYTEQVEFFDKEKFAELIIRECAEIAYNKQYKHSAAHTRGERRMKLCKDCEYFHNTDLANFCKSPQNGVSLIDGSPTVMWAQANRRGISEKHCGENAVFWVEKAVGENAVFLVEKAVTLKNPWYKFWK